MAQQEELSFALFFAVWAQLNNWDVPAFHWEVIQFLDTSNDWENNTAVLQVFRGAGKSTILDLFIVYMLCKDPTLRFLVLSADHLTARRITEDCLSIINRHPLAKKLKGKEQTWQKHRFFVRGSNDARNASVSAHGIMSNITSARADFIVLDDVEVLKNAHTEERRETLRKRISESTHILVPNSGRMLYVGTPHAFDSIYTERMGNGASTMTLPLIINPEGEFPTMVGESRWPDRFNEATIKQRQTESRTKGEFLSQYQLIPHQIYETVLDPAKIKPYEAEIDFIKANGTASAWLGRGTNREVQLVAVSGFWDVALSKARGDDSVFAIVYIAANGHIYVHRTYPIVGEVEVQCDQVAKYAEEHSVPIIKVETNGIGAFVPQVLMNYARPRNLAVDGVYTTKNKVMKIIESLETPLSGGFLHVHQSVMNSKFVTQLRDFSPKFHKGHDDYIDAVASAIEEQPIRIAQANFGSGDFMGSWQSGGKSYEAQVDYTTF